MRNKTFYPELVVKLLEEPSSKKEIEVLGDDLKRYTLVFDTPIKDIGKFFENISLKKVNSNLVNKKKKTLNKRKDIKKEIMSEIYEEHPEWKTLTPMDEDFQKIMDELERRISKKAEKLAYEDAKIKKGSIIKIAGIIDENKIISKSAQIDENGNALNKGIYSFAVISRGIPLIIEQKTNGKPLVRISYLINKEQFKVYAYNQIKTLEAATREKITLRGKEYTLKSLPKPYIKKVENLPTAIMKAIEIINTPKEDIKSLDINGFLNDVITPLYGSMKVKHPYEKYLIAFKYLKDYILTDFENNIKKVKIYPPLGINTEEFNEMVKVVLEGNKSGKEGRLGIIDSLLNTTFVKYKLEKEEEIRKIIEEEYFKLQAENKLKFHAKYTTETETWVGFFPHNIQTSKAVLTSYCYTQIIKNVYEKIKKGGR